MHPTLMQGLERKLSAAEKAPSGYQPFSTSHPEEEVHESRVKAKVLLLNFLKNKFYIGNNFLSGLV